MHKIPDFGVSGCVIITNQEAFIELPFCQYLCPLTFPFTSQLPDMSPQTNLDRSKVSLLHFWHSGLRSPTEIARKCKLPVSTVAYNLKKLRSTHSLKHRGKNGRKRLVGPNASRTIGQMIRRNKEVTAFQIATRFEQEEGTNVSCWTVRRHLR